jgi:retron-type reverse transcriptase
VIEGDISKFFDTVNHAKLIIFLEKRIRDNKFINLIREGLEARIVLPSGGEVTNDFGVPQGGVLSPLLANVYLHELYE